MGATPWKTELTEIVFSAESYYSAGGGKPAICKKFKPSKFVTNQASPNCYGESANSNML